MLRASLFLILLFWGQSGFSKVSLDHITLIVKDLDESASKLARLGFTLKKPHVYKAGFQKGLTTQAIRFASGQYLQLIGFTKKDKKGLGKNLGELGKWYQKILKATEGGATVILQFDEEREIKNAHSLLNQAGLTCELLKNDNHDWLSFKTKSPYSNLAFITYRNPPHIGAALINHKNKVTGIHQVIVNAPGDPYSWAKIIKLTKSTSVGLKFVETAKYRDPLLFIREVILETSDIKLSKSFQLGNTKFSFK